MSDRDLKSIDALGSRLSAAFTRAEAVEAAAFRPRWLRPRLAFAAGAVVLAAVFALLIGRGEAERVFTVQEALAEVAAAAFDEPTARSGRYLQTRTQTKNLYSSSYAISERDRTEILMITSFENERWFRPRSTGWRRVTSERGEFVTELDRNRAKRLKRKLEAEGKRMARARKRRGDSRPVPNMFSYHPFDAALDPKLPARSTRTCRIPAWAWVIDGASTIPPNLPTPTELPSDPAAVYRLFRKKADSEQAKLDREQWTWDRITSYLSIGASVLTPEQRSAVVRSLGYVPGVATAGLVDDPLGRKAFGFSRQRANVRHEIYFDPETSLATFTRSQSTGKLGGSRGHVPTGTVIFQEALLDYSYVDAPPKLSRDKAGNDLNSLTFCPDFSGPGERQLRKHAKRIERRLKGRIGQ